MNVLVTCAGRRVELVRAFKSALAGIGGGRVAAADCRDDAPALAFADMALSLPPLAREDDYLLSLVAAAKGCGASLVVPTIDTELPLLARRRDEIRERSGARVLVSSPECVGICADKAETARFFSRHGIPAPETWPSIEAVCEAAPEPPVVVKPARGSSSNDVFVARTRGELEFFMGRVQDAVAQRMLDGVEYTVDALLGFDGEFVAAVPRRRLAVRSGEILKGRIDMEPRVIAAARPLLAALGAAGAIGPLTLQGFLCRDGAFRFTEVNPRFGGGAPMTFAAGADYPAWICRALAGLPPPRFDVRDGALFSRFDSTVEIHPGQGGAQR